MKNEMMKFYIAPTVSLIPQNARKVISKTARRAMTKITKTEPYYMEPPHTLRVQFVESRFVDRAAAQTEPAVSMQRLWK